jgi:hypothetical protein
MFESFKQEAMQIAARYYGSQTTEWLRLQGELAALAYRHGFDHAPALRRGETGHIRVEMISSDASTSFYVL